MDERTALIALSRLKMSRGEKRSIIAECKAAALLFEKGAAPFAGTLHKAVSSFQGWRQIERDLITLDRIGARVVTILDDEYPPLLRDIPDAPIVLYKKGPLRAGSNTLAIVGSRKATFEGVNLAEKVAQTLSSAGITIVSGFARGVDSAAHRGALKEISGGTIAVFGCGIDICYPPENKGLYKTMGEKSLILTEYGPSEEPLPFRFPERNRIIAGLSRGILVVEASQKSGSLITARLGLEYGREVMAIPGSVFRQEHKGANALIKEGAKLVDGIDDIITTCFPDFSPAKKEPEEINAEEKRIFSVIGSERVHVDEIIGKTGMEAGRAMAILTKLEIKELIREIPGGFFMRK